MTARRLLLLGSPGSGKGTQGALLATAIGVPEISTGEIFRYNVGQNTELGKAAKRFIESGQLVPDDITVNMVRDRLLQPDAANGFLLDGFPRDKDQLVAFDAMCEELGITLDCVIKLAIDEATVIQRLLHRAAIEGRSDDTEPVIRQRLSVYNEKTLPLGEIFARRSIFHVIDGEGDVDAIHALIMDIVDSSTESM